MARSKDIRTTIQNLLNLANNKGASQAEAQAALLKAKELMMKYNLDQEEIMSAAGNSAHRDVKSYRTDVTFSKQVEPWIADLADLIARNSRCESYFVSRKGERRKTIAFYGYDEDLQICVIMFNYALYCIWEKFPEIRNRMKWEYGMTIKECRPYTDSYAVGFLRGMKDAFQKQYEEHKDEWGLVALTPTAVVEYAKSNVKIVDLDTSPKYLDSDCFHEGVRDGKKWAPQRALSTTEVSTV